MATRINKCELSAMANSLRTKVLNLREEILQEISKTTTAIQTIYSNVNGLIDMSEGYISLSNGVVHFAHDSDGNLNEVIVSIHTNKPYVQTDCLGQKGEVLLSDISDLNLIHIISELDHQLENPEIINIDEEPPYIQ